MIHKYGKDAAGADSDEGCFAVHPEGHIVVIPPHQPLKDGFRWASLGEIEGVPESTIETASEPEPLPEPPIVHESIVELTSE